MVAGLQKVPVELTAADCSGTEGGVRAHLSFGWLLRPAGGRSPPVEVGAQRPTDCGGEDGPQQQPRTCTTADDRKRGVPTGRSDESPGPGDASAASNAAALGTVVGKFPSHNVAALNPMAMGETRDTLETPKTRAVPWGLCGTFRHSTQGRVNARSARIDLPWALFSRQTNPTWQLAETLFVVRNFVIGLCES